MWGRGITEIHRPEGSVSKAHYLANMTRVKYVKDAESNNSSFQFALHNFIPGPNSDLSENKFDLTIRDHNFTIVPVGNYQDQANKLIRYGGNFRTSSIKTKFRDESGGYPILRRALDESVFGMTDAISLALGTLVTIPQKITFDPTGNRNDVEHYASESKPFSAFIATQKWDTPIKETVHAWFAAAKPIPFKSDQLAVWIRQHLDACATEIYLESKALAAATLLDVMAGHYSTMWSTRLPHKIPFELKLTQLTRDVGIALPNVQLTRIIKARNSLVHAGKFVTSESDSTYREYKNLVRLGRSILLRLIGFPSTLHEEIET